MLRRATAAAPLALAALLLLAAPVVAAPAISGEFSVPGLGSNNKLVQGPEGNMWLTLGGGAGNDVAKITPDGGVTEYKVEAVTPLGIAVGPEGRLWVARNNGLVSFDPADPVGTKQVFNVPQIGTSPSIVLGPDGNLWTAGENKLAKVPPANPVAATEVPVPGLQAPKDIDATGSLIVIAALEKVFAVSTAGAVVGEQKIANQAQGVAGNPNGQYAYTQPTAAPKEIGLLSPTAAPIVRSAEGRDPFGIALGSDGAYWSPDFITDGLMRISADGTVSSLAGFAKNSAPRQIAAGPGNTLWVTLEMTKKVGRVSGLEPPVVAPPVPGVPETAIVKGPKGRIAIPGKRRKVTFAFTSPGAGASFQCRLRRLPRKPIAKATKAADFGPCRSPRSYRLRPGRYRFDVRAVLAGVTDPNPAGRSFRIVRLHRG